MTTQHESRLGVVLQRARAGDAAARDELFALCRNYVAVVARAQLESRLKTKLDASDVVQQSLFDAHRGFGGFDGSTPGQWLAWLRQITTNNARDAARHYCGADKRRLGRERPLAVPGESYVAGQVAEPADGQQSPSALVMQHETELEVADALARLPDDYQQVILLRNVQRLSFNEVAERMERSRPAVQMLWMRAIKKLQEEVHR